MSDKKVETYDMSLRLWSDDVPMQPVVRDLGMNVTHLYERGQTIILPKGRSRPIADQHYASLAKIKTSNEADIATWLDDTLRRLDGHPSLPGLMRSGRVEALLWIATLGGDRALPPPPVEVDPARVATATRLGARIFVEDYHRFDEGGVPGKRWLN